MNSFGVYAAVVAMLRRLSVPVFSYHGNCNALSCLRIGDLAGIMGDCYHASLRDSATPPVYSTIDPTRCRAATPAEPRSILP